MIKQDRGTQFSAISSGTATTLTTTKAAVSNAILFVTDLSITTEGTQGAWVLTTGPTTTAGTTNLWQGTGNVNVSFSQPIPGNVGGSMYVTSNGTGTLYTSFSGFYILTK